MGSGPPRRLTDVVLMAFFLLFAFTSLVMEMYVVFEVDLETATDPLGRAWNWYAHRDPIFHEPPLFLWIMCAVDAFLFGPFYLVLLYAFWGRREWIRAPGLAYVGTIVYSTVVYFGIEFLDPLPGTDLWLVFWINVPYTLVPLWLGWRLRRAPVFPGTRAAD
jgi:hypothetical protein